MPVVGCPQCGARVIRPESGRPICPRCGYGRRAAGGGASRLRSVYGDPHAGGKMDLPVTATGRIVSDAGRPRDPLSVVLVMAGTFGIYWFVWMAVVFRELSLLHGRDHPWIRFILGLPLPPLLLLYLFMEVAQLNVYRLQRGMAPGIGVGRFVGLFLLGAVVVLVTTIIFAFWLVGTVAGYIVLPVGMVGGVLLMGRMVWRVQESVNGIWRDAGVTG